MYKKTINELDELFGSIDPALVRFSCGCIGWRAVPKNGSDADSSEFDAVVIDACDDDELNIGPRRDMRKKGYAPAGSEEMKHFLSLLSEELALARAGRDMRNVLQQLDHIRGDR